MPAQLNALGEEGKTNQRKRQRNLHIVAFEGMRLMKPIDSYAA